MNMQKDHSRVNLEQSTIDNNALSLSCHFYVARVSGKLRYFIYGEIMT